MKKITHYILYILIACTALLNIQCSENGKEKTPLPELVHAESVMFDHPDSALHILEHMSMPSARWDKENHALWCLLTSQAKVKQLMKISSDSLVRIAYDYYKPTNNARRRAMSALYMGDINYELGNIEEAMQYYLEGKTEVEKTDDYKTGYLIMFSLGKLYLFRNFADYALEACTAAYDYAVKDSNKRYQMTALRYLARSYCLTNELTKAIDTYNQCASLALELGLGTDRYYYKIQTEIALVYSNSGNLEKSLILSKSLPVEYQSSLLIGSNYLMLNQYDSAYLYLNRALNTDNVYTKKETYRNLYRLGDIPQYHKYLKTYCDSLLFFTDSVMSLDKGKEIIAYKEKYDHQKLIAEQQRLKLEKADAQRMMFIITICLIVVIAVVAYFYQKRLVRKETTIRKQSEQLQDFMLQLHEYETRLMQNNRYMEELREQLSSHDNDSDERHEQQEQMERLGAENSRLQTTIQDLQKRIGEYSSRLSEARKDVEQLRSLSEESLKLKERERRLTDYVVDNHRLVAELRTRSRVLSESEWQELTQLCESTWGDFIHRLLAFCPQLTEQELRLCLLIRLRFGNAQLAAIFAVSPASISQKKFRLKKHLSESGQGSFPEEMTLDRWLAEF
ncbi:tetratricopeptide repeat protein [Phocaeicola barnesiae]|uniref:tetratricopeptide repeat protein n=1 Tax=Phocaeicola barnesiae TaxID=376804 RepID=UPI00243261D0|nr:hypothetical protein [Phocaeicola barnesiae]